MKKKQCEKCRYNLSDTKEVKCAVKIEEKEENCSMYFEKEEK